MKFVFHLFVLTFITFATPTFANQERFNEAVELWLDGDDATSLPMMSKLAHEGFEPAMLFLGRIQQEYRNWSPWITNLAEVDRSEILTFDGQNWLTQVSADRELSEALMMLDFSNRSVFAKRSDVDDETLMQAVSTLISNDEALLTNGMLVEMAMNRKRELETIAELDLPIILRYITWYARTAIAKSGEEYVPIIIETRAAFEESDLQAYYYYKQILGPKFLDYFSENQLQAARFTVTGAILLDLADPDLQQQFGAFGNQLLKNNVVSPLIKYCEQTCQADDVKMCVTLLFTGVGGYGSYISISSPLQSLISAEHYRQSPRHIIDVLAGISPPIIESFRNLDLAQCNRDLLEQMDEYQ